MNYADHRIKAIVEISTMVTGTDNFFEIKDHIIEKMLKVIYPAKACVNLFIRDYQYAHLVCSDTLQYIPKVFEKNQRGEYHIPYASYPDYIHEAVQDKKVIWIKNVFEDERAKKEVELAVHEGYQSRAVFPLISSNEVIGFMTCFFVEQSDQYTEDDIDFIASVASLIGLSIEITKKKRDADFMIKKLRGSLNLINKASDELYKNLGFNKFLELLTSQVAKVTFSTSSLILMKYFEGECYKSTYGKSLDLKDAVVKLQGKLKKTKHKIINGRYYNEEQLPSHIKKENIRSILYHKLVKDGREIGFIAVANAARYSEDDLKILNIFALQIIFALERFENASTLIAHKLIEKELELVEKQQKLMMPENHIALEGGVTVSYYYQPASNVGGDFCDIFLIGEAKVAIFIADIMGHGILSNYFVAMMKGALKASIGEYATAGDILNKLNKTLYDDFNSLDNYSTATLGILDLRNNRMNASNGGHHLPIGIKVGDNNEVIADEIILDRGLPLGIFQNTYYVNTYCSLLEYTLICFFTDGLIEAMNAQGEMFGVGRLKELLVENYLKDSNAIYEIIKTELEKHTSKKQRNDDWIVMLIKKQQ